MNIFKNNKVPKWVMGVSDPSDRDILIQLANSSSKNLSTPRSARFTFRDVKEMGVAEDIAQHLKDRDWIVAIEKDVKTKEFFWIEAVKDQYKIEEESFNDDINYFNHLARMYDITFDGWEAESD